MNPATLRAYLLGQLAGADRHAVEARMFEDDAFDSLLQEAETDLLDDWARGRLSPREADAVVNRFPAAKRALARQLAARARPPRRNVLHWWLAVAALLLAALSGAFWLQQHQRPGGTAPVANRVDESKLQVLALRTPSTRGASVPLFRVTPQTATVRIIVPAPGALASYELELESAGAPVHHSVSPLGGTLALDLPVASLPTGNCDVLVFGPDRALVATYAFRVERD